MTEKTSTTESLRRLRSRIRDAWDLDPVFIDPIIAPGLTKNQKLAVKRASETTAESGIPHFIAIVPEIALAVGDDWDRFTADLAYAVHADGDAEQSLVLFSEGASAAAARAYLVDDNGPVVPPDAANLTRSATDDFLPVELSVPYLLGVLVAAAKGTQPPDPPDFDTRDPGDRSEDYIEATGLGNGNPDVTVFGAAAVAALGLSVWLMRRREKYSWKTSLTTAPELVRSARLRSRADQVLEPLPEPHEPSEETWQLYDRGRRIQDALRALVESHPDWADNPDFAHRCGVFVLVSTDKWVRKRLRGSSSADEEAPRFCFLFPHHRGGIERFALEQNRTMLRVDLCEHCRAEINAGHEPERLMVPKRPGSKRAVPYFRRSDAYAASGFGSFQPLEDALVEAQSVRAGQERSR